jgi:tRNA modification GTPase
LKIDTIAAVATPPGRGGVSIVRISGPQTSKIAAHILGQLPRPRKATYNTFLDSDGVAIDAGIALYFTAPHSFTGEDVLELQGHGGPVVMDLLLKRVLSLGARCARPGEFSERAFLNEKLDLAQAEAVADLIDSHTEQAARCALRSLQGEFSNAVHDLVARLIDLRVYVEAALDFPEEEIDYLADGIVLSRLEHIQHTLRLLKRKAYQGRLLQEGMRLVIAGRPNAGKSSLLNRLAEQDAAIVSEIPGTTRDVMHREIQLDGMPVMVSDTAGLRSSPNPIEQEGIRRAWREIKMADLVILLIDDSCGFADPERQIKKNVPDSTPVLRVWNKIDLGKKSPGYHGDEIYVSAKTGQGLEDLRRRLKAQMGYKESIEGIFTARRRHLEGLEQAENSLVKGREQLQDYGSGELLAEELRRAQQALGQITGEFTSDDLLGKIFSSFCIGK